MSDRESALTVAAFSLEPVHVGDYHPTFFSVFEDEIIVRALCRPTVIRPVWTAYNIRCIIPVIHGASLTGMCQTISWNPSHVTWRQRIQLTLRLELRYGNWLRLSVCLCVLTKNQERIEARSSPSLISRLNVQGCSGCAQRLCVRLSIITQWTTTHTAVGLWVVFLSLSLSLSLAVCISVFAWAYVSFMCVHSSWQRFCKMLLSLVLRFCYYAYILYINIYY